MIGVILLGLGKRDLTRASLAMEEFVTSARVSSIRCSDLSSHAKLLIAFHFHHPSETHSDSLLQQ